MDDDPWVDIGQPTSEDDGLEILEQDEGPSSEQKEIEIQQNSSFSEETHEQWNHPFDQNDFVQESAQILPLKLNTSKTIATYFLADSKHFHHIRVFKDVDIQTNMQVHWTLSRDEIVGFRHFNSEQLRAFSQMWSLLLVALIITSFLTLFSAIEGALPLILCLVAFGIPWLMILFQIQYIVFYGPRRKYRFIQWIWNHDAYLSRVGMKYFGSMMQTYLNEGNFSSEKYDVEASHRPKVVVKPPRTKPVKTFEAKPSPLAPVVPTNEGAIEPIAATHPPIEPQPTPAGEQLPPSVPLDGPPIQHQSNEPQPGPPVPNESVAPYAPPQQLNMVTPPMPASAVSPPGPPIPPPLSPMPGPPAQRVPTGPPAPPSPPAPPVALGQPTPPNIPTLPPPLPPPPMVMEPAISTEEQQALLEELS